MFLFHFFFFAHQCIDLFRSLFSAVQTFFVSGCLFAGAFQRKFQFGDLCHSISIGGGDLLFFHSSAHTGHIDLFCLTPFCRTEFPFNGGNAVLKTFFIPVGLVLLERPEELKCFCIHGGGIDVIPGEIGFVSFFSRENTDTPRVPVIIGQIGSTGGIDSPLSVQVAV